MAEKGYWFLWPQHFIIIKVIMGHSIQIFEQFSVLISNLEKIYSKVVRTVDDMELSLVAKTNADYEEDIWILNVLAIECR